MSDDRIFNKKGGHSQKVNSLTPDEELVWRTYIQVADDFGVMRFAASSIQDGHDRFAKKTTSAVLRMLTRVRAVGLIQTFEHQARVYCYQQDWQDYQKKRYAKATIHPRIPVRLLAACTRATQWLHTLWPGGDRERTLAKWTPEPDWTPPDWQLWVPPGFESRSRNGNENGCADRANTNTDTDTDPDPDLDLLGEEKSDLRVRAREAEDTLAERAGRFVERYKLLFTQYRHGAKYLNKPNLDYLEALQLVAVWDDARLDLLATAFFTTDEPFCRNGTGSIAQFRSRASWCDARLREKGL